MSELAKTHKIETNDEQRKVLLIYNPHSGNGMFTRYLDLIISKFQERGFLIRPVRGAGSEILDYVFSHIHDRFSLSAPLSLVLCACCITK